MERFEWMPYLAAAIVVTLGLGNRAIDAAEPKARPNILFIITDDQSPLDLKAYNQESQLETPNIDRLARQGMVFDDAYHMGAFVSGVCLPSRHMIKSGRTLWHLNFAPEANKYCPPHLERNTIAAVFNRAGYDTMRTGKPGNSYEAAKQQFTVRKDSVGRDGVAPEGSAWHADRVLEYLEQRQAANDRDPFLIYFGFSHPHDPRNGTPGMLAKYGATNHDDPNALPAANPTQPALPINYLPAHPFKTTLLPDQRDETQVSGVWKNRDERTIRNERGRYFACSENIDTQIGRVLKKLEAMGELDNTFVFYTSDHGIAIGRHGLQGKQNLYQHTWRVPMIVKGPGIRPGSRVTGNIYLLDCLATLCDIASIPPPETNEGISFKPILDGRSESSRDVLYGVHCGGTKPGMRCVKKGDWKLIKYDGDNGAVHETQLFNLAENPDELIQQHHDPKVIALTHSTPAKHQVNLATDPRYADKLQEMEALLLAEMRRLNDPWRLWDQPADGLTPPADAPASKQDAAKKMSHAFPSGAIKDERAVERQSTPPPAELASYFEPPEDLAGDLGTFDSPLKFYDGRRVTSAAEWPARRTEILKTWHDLMGPWPPLLDHPQIERMDQTRRENFHQHRVQLQIAPDRTSNGYLLVPDAEGPFPAMLVVYYEPETSIGANDKALRDFGYQLAKRGFVTLSIGSPPGTYYPTKESCRLQPLSYHAYVAANCHTALAALPEVDAARIGVMGHSYGGKWAMFASCLHDKFACGVWCDGGIVFDEQRSNVNYWEPWYLGFEPGVERKPGIPKDDNPRTGPYRKMIESGRDLHELHALMAPRPFLVSGGSEDHRGRWKALNHAIAVNSFLGQQNRVAMTNRPGHSPSEESNEQIYAFLKYVLQSGKSTPGSER